MRTVVTVEVINVEISVYEVLARKSTRHRARPFGWRSIHIRWPHGYELRTGETTTRKFVGNKTLIRIRDWVDVVDPAEPTLHASRW